MIIILSLSLHPLAEAVRLAGELQDVGFVGEPVEQGRLRLHFSNG